MEKMGGGLLQALGVCRQESQTWAVTIHEHMGGGDSRTWPSQLTTSTMDGTGGVTTTRKQIGCGVPRNLK